MAGTVFGKTDLQNFVQNDLCWLKFNSFQFVLLCKFPVEMYLRIYYQQFKNESIRMTWQQVGSINQIHTFSNEVV